MKKILLTTLLLLTLTLTACGSASNTNQASSTQESATLPTATQLILGTLKLDGTEQAVTSGQAKDLLVMWQVYQDLASSDTAAQEEIDGLVDQIQETMTTEQTKSISDMSLTQQDVVALMQEQSIGTIQSQQSSSETFSFSPSAGGDPGAGGPPDGGMAGGPPDGGMGGDMGAIGGVGSNTSTDQTQGTGTGSNLGGTAGTSTVLVDAVIQYLQQIVNA